MRSAEDADEDEVAGHGCALGGGLGREPGHDPAMRMPGGGKEDAETGRVLPVPRPQSSPADRPRDEGSRGGAILARGPPSDHSTTIDHLHRGGVYYSAAAAALACSAARSCAFFLGRAFSGLLRVSRF